MDGDVRGGLARVGAKFIPRNSSREIHAALTHSWTECVSQMGRQSLRVSISA